MTTKLPGTVFSQDGVYRYTLSREWGDMFTGSKPGYVAFICLNPSTANETTDDPTVRRCVAFSKAWGYSAFVMLNLFAVRATDPMAMLVHPQPVGPENDDWLCRVTKEAAMVVCAWGNKGGHKGRCYDVQRMLTMKHGISLLRLRQTGAGFPEHPLYIPGDTKPQPL